MKARILALVLLIAPIGTLGCIPALPAVAKALGSVSEALALLNTVNAVVGEFFGRHPDVPTVERDTYLLLHEAVTKALTEYQRLVEARGDLEDGDVVAAFQRFVESYQSLSSWLTNNGLLDKGKLLIDGRVISSMPAASSFRRN